MSADASSRRRPAPGWYAVGAVIALLGVAGALLLGTGAAGLGRSAAPEPVGTDGRVVVGDGDLAVWMHSSELTQERSATGAELGVGCSLEQDGATVPVPALSSDRATVEDWHLVAVLPADGADPMSGRSARLTCESALPLYGDATWATSDKPQVLLVLLLVGGAFVVGVGGIALGALAAFVVWWLRRRGTRA